MFAEHLFREGDYYRAITEYKRIMFMEPDPVIRAWLKLRIGQSYLAGKKYTAAQAVFSELSGDNPIEKIKQAASFLLGRSYYLDSRYSQALDEFNGLLSEVHDPEIRNATLFLVACVNIKIGALDEAKKVLSQVAANDPLSKRSQLLVSMVDRGKRLPHKSPALAGLLSVVPGLGHVYIGEYEVGISAFVWNGMFAYAAIESFRHRLWGPAVLLSVVELMWYSGTIYGAVSGAHRFNRDAQLNFLQALDNDIALDTAFPADDALVNVIFTGHF